MNVEHIDHCIIPEQLPRSAIVTPRRMAAKLLDGQTRDQVMRAMAENGFDITGKIESDEAFIMFSDGTGGIDVEAYAKMLQEPDARGDCFSPEAAQMLAEQVDDELRAIYGTSLKCDTCGDKATGGFTSRRRQFNSCDKPECRKACINAAVEMEPCQP